VTYVHDELTLADLVTTGKAKAPATPFVLSVSRQVTQKGTDTLLRAFALVHREFSGLSLVIIGDGPVLEQNKALARTLKIEKQTIFLGDMSRAEVLPFFEACTLFVLPSRAEPFGLVPLEAAYFKKGIVATSVGGIPEIIIDGVNGLLVEPDDPVRMSECITALLNDPHLAGRLGTRAHQKLRRGFFGKTGCTSTSISTKKLRSLRASGKNRSRITPGRVRSDPEPPAAVDSPPPPLAK
jgi:glycosyltransferase involved in cell wall biosynthesis